MDFTFTDEQRLAAQALRDLLTDHCDGTALRATAEALSQHGKVDMASQARVDEIAALGLSGMLVSETQGGLGLEPIDLVLLAEEAGRAALPEPVIDQAGVALPLLADMALRDAAAAPVLQDALVDKASVLFALDPRSASAWLGTTHYVLSQGAPGELLLFRREELELSRRDGLDPLRPLTVARNNMPAPLALWSGSNASTAIDRALARGAVLVAAQQLGLAQRMVDMSVAYAGERKQFGKPIGSKQAIQHLMANVQIRIEFARPVVYAAAATLSRAAHLDATSQVRVSHAKLSASDAADLAARTAIQVHGAMGYSWELDLQFFAKRAWALTGSFGDRNFHMKRVQSALLSGRLPLGPDCLFQS